MSTSTRLAAMGSGLRRIMLRWLVAVLAGVLWQLVSRGTWNVAMQLLGAGGRPGPGAVDPALPSLRGLSSHEVQLSGCLLSPASVPERLGDVGGLALVKSDLVTAIVIPLSHPRAFFGTHQCLEPSRGVTLVGPPGTGKTMLARALAAEAGANLLTVTLTALEDKYYGESSKLLRAAFSLACKAQPCVLFFDEIDGLMRERSAAEGSASYGLKTEFLSNMDSLRASDAVVVIGSTNNLALLDPAVKRRLPKVYHIDKPAAADRVRILELLLQREPELVRGLSECTRDLVLHATDGCTGSDLQELYRTAAGARLSRQLRREGFAKDLETAPDPAALVEPIQDGDWALAIGAMLAGQAHASRSYCSGSRGATLVETADPPDVAQGPAPTPVPTPAPSSATAPAPALASTLAPALAPVLAPVTVPATLPLEARTSSTTGAAGRAGETAMTARRTQTPPERASPDGGADLPVGVHRQDPDDEEAPPNAPL